MVIGAPCSVHRMVPDVFFPCPETCVGKAAWSFSRPRLVAEQLELEVSLEVGGINREVARRALCRSGPPQQPAVDPALVACDVMVKVAPEAQQPIGSFDP